MESLFEKLQPKWLAVLFGVFILGRAITALLSSSFGATIMSDDSQAAIYGLTFTYIGNTVLLPLIFSLLSVELAKNSVSPVFFFTVLAVHLLSVLFVSASSGLAAVRFGGNPMQGGQEGLTVLSESALLRSITTLLLVSITTVLAYYWRKMNFRILVKPTPNA
ncbi:Uncharacterised protein [Halioglobus japonicus]|nr:Uncharacterised protein [Halioglobus japonicus]